MSAYTLQITLLSPLTSGAGAGRVGVVDRDVAFDEWGLPVLPGRRLKGLWREAYRDVVDAWNLCGKNATSADLIFGKTGQRTGHGDACIRIGNGELNVASSLREWLSYLHAVGTLHHDDVLQYYATVRAQTAIDRHTGAPREDTLRLTRTLRPGLVFHVPIDFAEVPCDELLNALALGAAGLQHMGTARTRGLGRVCCRLLKEQSGGPPCDLTDEFLGSRPLPSIHSPASRSQSPQPLAPQSTSAPCMNPSPPTHILRYRLKLSSPAVISASDGASNVVVTRHDVPGSQMLGIAAWSYLRQVGHAPNDCAFRRAFLDGGLRFLAAYPEASEGTPQRMIPIPHSIRRFKNTQYLVDFVEFPAAYGTQRLDRRYARIQRWRLETQGVKTERSYHHARHSDRRKGRALGTQIANGGTFFQYEAIQPGQAFQGAVLGTDKDLSSLQTWLPGGEMVRFGRSRSAQYGEANLEWIDRSPQVLNGCVEWSGFVPQGSAVTDANSQGPPILCDDRLIITTLSPLLSVNGAGHPEACFPEDELAQHLGLNPDGLTLSCSYTRTELIGGYNAHLRMPRQQWSAISAGSVFVFALACSVDGARLTVLEQEGLGLRKGEGYGRVAVNRQHKLGLDGLSEKRLDDPDRRTAPCRPDGDIPSAVQDLLQDVARTGCIESLRKYAMTAADEVPRGKIPSNSLLRRLRLFLIDDEPIASLKRLRPVAEKQLDCKINLNYAITGTSMTLDAVLQSVWTDPKSVTRDVITQYVDKFLHDENLKKDLVEKLVEDSATMGRHFLDSLLVALSRPRPAQGAAEG